MSDYSLQVAAMKEKYPFTVNAGRFKDSGLSPLEFQVAHRGIFFCAFPTFDGVIWMFRKAEDLRAFEEWKAKRKEVHNAEEGNKESA